MSEIINTEPPAHRTTEPILNGPPLEVVIHPSAQEPMEVWTTLTFIWAGQTYVTELAESDRVFDLKEKLFDMTTVPPERQKILGLVKGKLPPDEVLIRELKLGKGKKFTLVGTPMGQELKELSEYESPDVFNDLDLDITTEAAAIEAFAKDRRNIRKVKEATAKLKLEVMNPPREGKRLLVLDLDYTILDTKPLTSGSLPPSECARPGLHAFLEAVYPHYDIVIWSQTHWMWLEAKLVELEMVGSDKNYKISFVLDKSPMFTVFSTRDGQPFKHHVKPLQIIWSKFPHWSAKNTIHIDDLSRNFALNPGSGLKIHAFKNAHTEQAMQDRELEKLSRYLVLLAGVDDFRNVNHKDWKKALQ